MFSTCKSFELFGPTSDLGPIAKSAIRPTAFHAPKETAYMQCNRVTPEEHSALRTPNVKVSAASSEIYGIQ
ncbi:hypothetical protein AciX8_2844 [Granulicella mallensis MP5ACTX8]|uniref:Uncharacterized protein n=1 Tax=Granulicella mallensis (strain ATCC BAA-1857 / DSM 23137 / MP5ACTX8) TaxID=682795 RepID=G8NPR0_GRAMM|nr:hypothetical protein AciX8_2844 [Granulicella mallensis MP5ACTX8]